jgi:hypothetical protein
MIVTLVPRTRVQVVSPHTVWCCDYLRWGFPSLVAVAIKNANAEKRNGIR